MMDLLAEILMASIMSLIAGFGSTKVAIWSVPAIIGVYLSYLLVPGLDASNVAATMWPLWLDIWLIFPEVLEKMWASGSQGGLAKGLVFLGVGLLLALPYIAGMISAFIFWPELFVFRVV